MEEYQIDDLSESKLKFGYWYVTHKNELKKILVGVIIGLNLVVWGLAGYGLTIYITNYNQESQLINGIINTEIDFASFTSRHLAKDLEAGPPVVIYTGNNKYDFAASIFNPNKDRGVKKLSYQFVSGSYKTLVETVSILPGERVYLMSLANKSNRSLRNASLNIVNIRWQGLREKAKFTTNPFVITETKFTKATKDNSRSWVNFVAANTSVNNFWEASFQAVLYSSNQIVGINQISLEEFLAGEERNVEISWFDKLPRVSKVEVIPIINLYNKEIYFEVPGEATEL